MAGRIEMKMAVESGMGETGAEEINGGHANMRSRNQNQAERSFFHGIHIVMKQEANTGLIKEIEFPFHLIQQNLFSEPIQRTLTLTLFDSNGTGM